MKAPEFFHSINRLRIGLKSSQLTPPFLVADTRLYTLPCQSVRPSVTFLNRQWFLYFRSCRTVRGCPPCIRPCFFRFSFLFSALRLRITFDLVSLVLPSPFLPFLSSDHFRFVWFAYDSSLEGPAEGEFSTDLLLWVFFRWKGASQHMTDVSDFRVLFPGISLSLSLSLSLSCVCVCFVIDFSYLALQKSWQ